MIENLPINEWGECEEESKKDFLAQMKKFSQDMHEAIDTLTGVVELRKLDPQFESEAKSTSKQPSELCTAHCREVVLSWCDTIDKYLKEWNEVEEKKGEQNEEGPMSELEHWRQTQRVLTGISEQIKGPGCTTVLGLLHAARMSNNSEKEAINSLHSNWKKKESDLTEKLNEAKDNVKYLRTLEPYMEPLYSGKPTLIIESMRGLMHAIKMMFSIAKHYDKGSRMTILFSKITSQMITSCIQAITKGRTATELWDTAKFPVGPLSKELESCIKLNAEYKKEFADIKARLNANPKGKHYEFTDTVIFGKFDLFCRRVGKLKDLFETIEQFQVLGKHNLENMSKILTDFYAALDVLKAKNLDQLLNYKTNDFDIDFVSFNATVSEIESTLMQFISDKVNSVHSIEPSLRFLEKFKTILKRDNLIKDLDQKSSMLFNTYQESLKEIDNLYITNQENPPLVRNMPEHAGKIMWLNHLYDKVARPLRGFGVAVRKNTQNKTCIETAWKFMKKVGLHKLLIHEKWEKRVETSKAALQATLLTRGPDNTWQVNFETEIMTLIREAKCMSRMGMKLNENAKIILLQEEKFKTYYNELDYLIEEYGRIEKRIRSNTRDILKPHKEDLETRLRPGSITLTWTSMNIDGYLQHVHEGLRKLEQFIIKINDIMDNRIENNLKDVSKTELVDLSVGGKAFALDEFVIRQENCIKEKSKGLKAKNMEVEQAVGDLRKAILAYERDPHVGQVANEEMRKIVKYYYWSMYQALLHATKHSLNALKERVCERRKDTKEPMMKAFFEAKVQLENGVCVLSPPLPDIQNSINRAANAVLKSTKNVSKWIKGTNQTFYEWVAKDKEIVKVILLLTGSIEGTKNKVGEFLKQFEEFEWLWKLNITETQQAVSAKSTLNEDYEKELKKLKDTEDKIARIPKSTQIGAMDLKTDKIKESMLKILKLWKKEYSADLTKKVKNSVDGLKDEIKRLRVRAKRAVKDLATLGEVMQTLDDIRNKESEIKVQLKPVRETLTLLDVYLKDPDNKSEDDQKKLLEAEWETLVMEAEQRRTELQQNQTKYKKELIQNVTNLVEEAKEFCKEFREKGPNEPGLLPSDALDRLKSFKSTYDEVLKRKKDNCYRGENIFNLTHKKYEELDQTDKEMTWLLSLYTLYATVLNDISQWREILWIDVPKHIKEMQTRIVEHDRKCENLDDQLKKIRAYHELKERVDNFNKTLPLIEKMSKLSILPRHWEHDLASKIRSPITWVRETFTLGNFLDMKLIPFTEEINEISFAADEQLKIEEDLRDIDAHWLTEEFVLTASSKKKEVPTVIDTHKTDEIINKLEEHQTSINTMTACRSSTPHQDKLAQASSKYSDVYDTINKCTKVQKIWQFLEPVFHSHNVAKEMAQESKRFAQTEKDWTKIIEKINEEKNVIRCCENDMIKGLLKNLDENLEQCQKKLDTYLEKKRKEFPRFYFVSDTEVLNILSQGSDPATMMLHLASLFDGITNVEFDSAEKKFITKIMCVYSESSKEELTLTTPVKVEGQKIEDWLQALEDEMKKTVKNGIEEAYTSFEGPMRESPDKNTVALVEKYPSQICQIILKCVWTSSVEDGHAEPQSKKQSKDQIHNKMRLIITALKDLIKAPAEDANDVLKKMKLESLIAIQVNQVAVYDNYLKAEFETEKQKTVRMEWKKDTKELEVKIADFGFKYFYEFLKANEKLVITPLTDRCYISMALALRLQCGSCAVGPTGVGKTETIKDMGKTLGILVISTNCSEQHNTSALAKILKGVVSAGVWGNFDQFNRVEFDVLSVVAGHLEAISMAKRKGEANFVYPGEGDGAGLTKHVDTSAYFITVRDDVKSKVEMPDNIKVQFRQMAMMNPDCRTIIDVKLTAMGFANNEKLAEKFMTLYTSCQAQLSKQKHYDFGLRNIIPVFTAISNMKKAGIDMKDEEKVLAKAIREVNIPKLVGPDNNIFTGLLKDIFLEGFEAEAPKELSALEAVITDQLVKSRLNEGRNWKPKILQLYSICQVRHGIMVVGPTGAGKSTIIQVLLDSLSTFKGVPFKSQKINPKALGAEDFYGAKSEVNKEWVDGVFTKIWEKCNKKSYKQNTYILLDGPLDSSWIENLNSVLDDNKILTLANGQRIPMTDNVKLVFEVDQINHVEPSTVSRCGILFISLDDLHWSSLIKNYFKIRMDMRTVCNPNEMEIVDGLVKNYFDDTNIMDLLDKELASSMTINHAIRATSFVTMFNALLKQYSALDKNGYEQIFVFAMAWALGGLLEFEKKDHFQRLLIDKMGPVKSSLPHKVVYEKDSIYDYFLDKDSTGVIWKPLIVSRPDIPPRLSYSEILIPTMDTSRAEYIIDQISAINNTNESGQKSVLIVGPSGTAKSSSVILYSSKYKEKVFKMFTFSALTTPQLLHEGIVSQLARKRARNMEPEGDKIMMMFFDDMSMPMPNKWGYQPTLELIRQLLDQSGLYFLTPDQRGDFMNIAKLQFVGSMSDPGAGWRDIPNRLKRLFFSFNMSMPASQGIDSVFSLFMRSNFTEKHYEGTSIKVAVSFVEATTTLRSRILKNPSLNPSPAKFHYRFTMREVARVFQGILEANKYPEMKVIQNGKEGINSNQYLILLWRHECMRAFHDKLCTYADRQAFIDTLDGVTLEKYKDVLPEDDSIWKHEWLFCNFLRKDKKNPAGEVIEAAPKVYETAESSDALQKLCEEKLDEHNAQPNCKKVMDLVLFDEAIKNLLKITRVLQMPRGSALLVGSGGSGKQSMARLAVHIEQQKLEQLSTENDAAFFASLKEVYKALAAQDGVPTTVILSEGEIKADSIYEHLNSFLATGEITGLLQKDDRDKLFLNNKEFYTKEAASAKEDPNPRSVYKFLVTRVRDYLHLAISMSPNGIQLANRYRNFPAIFSSSNLIWFLPWSEEALVNVARRTFATYKFDCPPENIENLASHVAAVHSGMYGECAKYLERTKKYVYLSPRAYFSYINTFGQEYTRRITLQQENEAKIRVGIEKMNEAAVGLEKIKQEANKESGKQTEAREKVEKLLQELSECQSLTNKESEKVERKTEESKKQDERIGKEEEKNMAELGKALPYLAAAKKSAQALSASAQTEIKQKGSLDITRLIIDCLLIIFGKGLVLVTWGDYEKAKGDRYQFIKDSFEEGSKVLLAPAFNLQKKMLDFVATEMDSVNDETCELLEPYLNLPRLHEDQIAKASPALGHVLEFVRGVYDYHSNAKHMRWKLADMEKMKETQKIEKEKLARSVANLNAEMEKLDGLKKAFAKKKEEQEGINQQVKNLNSRHTNLNKLINELQEDKSKWAEDAAKFSEKKLKLLGDICLSSAFVNYCGPFNFEFRQRLIKELIKEDLVAKKVPCTPDLDVIPFLVEDTTIGEWQLEGLPVDEVTVQNAILLTMAPRFPLIIDPQGQALYWLKKKGLSVEGRLCEMSKLNEGATALSKSMEAGEAFIIENMDTFLPKILDDVLVSLCGKFKKRGVKIFFREKEEVLVDEKFVLYMTTRVPSPHFSPELSAKASIINFTMSQQALESALLSKITSKELRSVEEQLSLHQKNVNISKRTLQEIEIHILRIISSAQGSLLDNDQSVEDLNKQKKKCAETSGKKKESEEKTRDLMKKRDFYKSVAKRGTALYLSMQDICQLNWMYNTSFKQFLEIFDRALGSAKKGSTIKERSENISKLLTEQVFRYVYRFLFSKDRALYTLSLALRIKLVEEVIKQHDLNLFLKAGSTLEEKQVKQVPWLDENAYNNLRALSKHKFGSEPTAFFKDIFDKIAANEDEWTGWVSESALETKIIPDYNDKLAGEKELGSFMTLCLIRCIREDRTIMAGYKFISDPAVLEPKYENPPVDTLEDVFADSNKTTPILYLLSSVSDPTTGIEELCRKKLKKVPVKIALGEGQEKIKALVESIMVPANPNNLTWVILQNCHYGLQNMSGIMELISGKAYNIKEEFRIFMTTEETTNFPLTLLHSSIKVTNDPPKGLQAGMLRTLSQVVTQDRLEKVDSVERWKNVVFTMCFMHNILLERRKYGPIGFCNPYEFTNSDLDSCLLYLEKLSPSGSFEDNTWKIAQYMVCQIQYGGKVTDERDREILEAYGTDFFKVDVLKGDNYELIPRTKYILGKMDPVELSKLKDDVRAWSPVEEPSIYGLSNLASKAYRARESKDLLSSLMDIQPRDMTVSGGKTRDEEVREKLEKDLRPKLPVGFKDTDKKDKKGGVSAIYLFLNQEIRKYQIVFNTIKKNIDEILNAIEGNIIMTPDIDEAIQTLYNGKIPNSWMFDQIGVEWTWLSSSTAAWFKELGQRFNQLSTWLKTDKLGSYWLGGFFNPQGFLLALKQEDFKRKREKDKETPSIENFEMKTVVQGSLDWKDLDKFDYKVSQKKNLDKDKDEGVLIHGLYIEGAVCNTGKLDECEGGKDKKEGKIGILTQLSIVRITFDKKTEEAQKGTSASKEIFCPVYRYYARGDRNLITSFKLESAVPTKDADYWKKKGVAILCSKDNLN